jgi:formylglycine-generating enzyme required for sulfatase activity
MVFQPVDQLFFSQWETRVQDFAAFAAASATAIRPPSPPVPAPPDGTHPVTRITRTEAQNFCRWLTQKERSEGLLDDRREYRLPTDAEWSAAAGAPDIDPLLTSPSERHLRITGVYPWLPHYLFPPLPDAANPKPGGNLGDLTAARSGALNAIAPEQVKAVDQLAYDDGTPFTAPVGSFRIAEFKLHDMAGNVSEFVADTYGGKNPANAPFAVTRGASWATPATSILELNTQFRRAVPPDAEPDSWTGFRAVLAPVITSPSKDGPSTNPDPSPTSQPVSPEPPR